MVYVANIFESLLPVALFPLAPISNITFSQHFAAFAFREGIRQNAKIATALLKGTVFMLR